ncbi:MAG: DNA-binding response regulator [Arcobacter sp.]|jgi:DNA-binding response OmpR family regulator|uniref:response regulator n=1 Tax=uncultured Arcobacter sp. TaxID=165434 RepID=UPI000CB4F4FD|nr:response regulator [uncultured Arcobacter sp.]PLY11569.1 MAG: DNA-binding response regulator [Arcobacter sp.]|tara:strand:- start:6954 stop:7709 length:756 start_codon:yes stop_codon:yes gene_type:complete
MDKIKILIVEDESIIALNLKETLIELGYEPCGVSPNKCKALKILDKITPDLILMDIYLKGPTTGIEFANELKITLPDVPVIFLTANSELSTIKKASETFAYGYILKPYKKSNLHATIEVALSKAQDDNTKNKKLNAIENVNKTLMHKMNLTTEGKSRTVQLKYGYLFDKENEILYYGDEPVKLTSKEIKIIKLLCSSPGYNISQEQLEYAIWQDEPAGYGAFRSVLFRLRNKIHKDLITNQNNTGYKIELF